MIVALQKHSTIRGKRKTPIKPGDYLKLYSGQRTKQCQLIGTAICHNTTPVKIAEDAPYILLNLTTNPGERWYRFTESALEHFYKTDGFTSYDEMKTFFSNQYGLPFSGDLIEWKNFKAAIHMEHLEFPKP